MIWVCQIFEPVDGFCVGCHLHCSILWAGNEQLLLIYKLHAHLQECTHNWELHNFYIFSKFSTIRLFWGTDSIDEHVVYLLIDYIELVFLSRNLDAHNVLMVRSKTVEQRSRRRLFVIFFHIAWCQVPGLHVSLSVGSKQHLPHKQ